MSDLDNIRAKVRALLAKTEENGCTEAEAFSALEKARAMMDAYDITPEQLELTREECILIRAVPKGHDPRGVKGYLVHHVGAFCDCKFWWSSLTQCFQFCGYRPDTEFAEWLLGSLSQFVYNELAAHLINSPPPPSIKLRVASSFIYGATTRIGERMRQIKEQSHAVVTSTGRALVVAKEKQVRAHMWEKGIHLKQRSRSRSINPDHGAAAAGRASGDRASFGRPVSGAGGTLRLK